MKTLTKNNPSVEMLDEKEMTDVEILIKYALQRTGIRYSCSQCGESLPIKGEPKHICKKNSNI